MIYDDNDGWNCTFAAAIPIDDGNSLLVGFQDWKFLYKFTAKTSAQLYYNGTLIRIRRLNRTNKRKEGLNGTSKQICGNER
jgi:hypothetical protein